MDPTPSPEPIKQQYDSRKLIIMATDIDRFRQNSSREIEEAASFGIDPSDLSKSGVAEEMEKVRSGIDRFYAMGQKAILDDIYYAYAEPKGWIRERKGAPDAIFKLDLPGAEVVPLDDLTQEQSQEFKLYLTSSASVSREKAVKILDKLLSFIPTPYTKHTESLSMIAVANKLDLGKKKLITNILPDLTDEEAKHFYGQLTTAKDIFDAIKAAE